MPPDGYTALTVNEEVRDAAQYIVEESDEFDSMADFIRASTLGYARANGLDTDEVEKALSDYR